MMHRRHIQLQFSRPSPASTELLDPAQYSLRSQLSSLCVPPDASIAAMLQFV